MEHIVPVTLDAIIDSLASAVAAKLRGDRSGSEPASSPSIAPRLLTVDQAAVYLARSKDAVQHMVAARKLPVVRDGRRVFLDVQELDRWIEQSKEPAEN
jgi:excisionase family DNA binding protein